MRPKYPATIPPFLLRTMARALRESRGATAVEYGLILAFVVIAMIVGLTGLAGSTTRMWTYVETRVAGAR
ncbi:Flp family type IVb pilin [Sphingomonas faeni]|uniref:Flp family type IVb pilin n=1 Tax=Sphingomonas faeni TaxID=185950 RepID=UPI0020C78F18|nr:Flp family type IVb pilin [Sphingomonas faeni]MCP8891073.1 Flp family type IVb pilin [Sphingomonas faeni]